LEALNRVDSPYGTGDVVQAVPTQTILRVSETCFLPFSPNELRAEELSVAELSLDLLCESLSVRNIILVFSHLLLEKKVLLVSSSFSVLTLVGEFLSGLLVPMQYSHVYAPLLPRKMLDLLMCPTPFLLGIHRSYAFKSDFPFVTDVCVVDLDSDEVNSDENGLLPAAFEYALFADLKRALSPRTLFSDTFRPGEDRVDAVRVVFRAAVLELLAGLPLASFSVEHSNEAITFVDETFWLKDKPPVEATFLAALARTQHFSEFVVLSRHV
jgi:hypothetical protein